jgi:hypothetical protein
MTVPRCPKNTLPTYHAAASGHNVSLRSGSWGVEKIRTLLAAWSQFPLASPEGSAFIRAPMIIVLTDSRVMELWLAQRMGSKPCWE